MSAIYKHGNWYGKSESETIQVETLPTASVDEQGKVYQYIGPDNDPLFSNYFYKCVQISGSFSWENVKVQPDGSLSMEITKSDYDNLSEAEKTDGTVYFVTDWSPEPVTYSIIGKFDKSNIYDTNERMIGSWMGKPLYQKVFTGTTPNNADWNVLIDESGCEFIMGAMYVKLSGDINVTKIIDLNDDTIRWLLQPSVNKVSIKCGSANYRNRPFYMPLQYTKTTDSAATGEVTYANENDYSTTETIIGTWIDGKPIYQKVYELSSTLAITADTWITLNAVNTSNVALLIKAIGLNKSAKHTFMFNDVQATDNILYIKTGEPGNLETLILQYTKIS